MGTTAKGAPYPDGGDSPDGPGGIQALAEWTDDRPGVAPYTYAEINALAGSELWEGRVVYQTNTGTNRPQEGAYHYNGVSWRLPWNMPWGAVAPPTSLTSDATSYVGFVSVPSLPITFTAVANRYYRITFTAPWHNNTASNGAQANILDGATQLALAEFGPNAATNGHINMIWVGTLSVGSHTITPQVAHDVAGAVNLLVTGTRAARLFIEDAGPSGIPT